MLLLRLLLFFHHLHSLQQQQQMELRVATNEVAPNTLDYAKALVEHGTIRPENLYISETNAHKYPVMRHIFHDPENPITTPYTMWFDDDSFVRPDHQLANVEGTSKPPWLNLVEAAFVPEISMIGSIYKIKLRGQQHVWVEHQPWYTGKPVPKNFFPAFVSGGWWTIRSEVIKKHDWPIPELDHRGGDVMLGELFRQQGLRMKRFNTGVAINADENGRDSYAKKRGYNSRPIGFDFVPPAPTSQEVETAEKPSRPLLDLGL